MKLILRDKVVSAQTDAKGSRRSAWQPICQLWLRDGEKRCSVFWINNENVRGGRGVALLGHEDKRPHAVKSTAVAKTFLVITDIHYGKTI